MSYFVRLQFCCCCLKVHTRPRRSNVQLHTFYMQVYLHCIAWRQATSSRRKKASLLCHFCKYSLHSCMGSSEFNPTWTDHTTLIDMSKDMKQARSKVPHYVVKGAYSQSRPQRQSTWLSCWDFISIKLGWAFDYVGTNSAMTHVLVLSAKVGEMSNCGKLQTFIIWPVQLLASKFHNNFNLRN